MKQPCTLIGLELRRARTGLTLKQFAKLMDINETTAARYERGDRDPPFSYLVKTAERLAHPMGAFVDASLRDAGWSGLESLFVRSELSPPLPAFRTVDKKTAAKRSRTR